MPEENIYKKIDRQTELLEIIAKQTRKTEKYILWGRVLSVLRLLIIIAPIILAIIYLPPFIQSSIDKIRGILPEIQELKGLDQTIQNISNKLPQ